MPQEDSMWSSELNRVPTSAIGADEPSDYDSYGNKKQQQHEEIERKRRVSKYKNGRSKESWISWKALGRHNIIQVI